MAPNEKNGTSWTCFLMQSLFRALSCYTLGSLLEVGLMYARVSKETEARAPLAADFAAKLWILLLASLLFGFLFVIFRAGWLPSPARRLLHIVLGFVPVVMVVQSLVAGNAELDMQSYVFFYFFAVLLYLAVYGICMLVSFVRKRKKLPK